MTTTRMQRSPSRAGRWGRTLPTLLVLGLVACSTDSILRTQDPDIISPGDLQNLQGAAAMYAGALGDFALAKDGGLGTDGALGLVEAIGFFSDEYEFGGTPPEVRAMDLRAVVEANNAWTPTYLNMHRAREAAERAAHTLLAVDPDAQSDSRIGEMYAISAMVHILLAEAYCSGIPFSTSDPEVVYGQPLSTSDALKRGLTRVDSADAFAAGDPQIVNLARVERGRALLDLGDFAGAATAVAGVPTGFAYYSLHSTATDRQVNALYVGNFETDNYSVSDSEGGVGLDFGTAGDPRVPTRYVGLSQFDNRTPMYRFLTIDSRSAPVLTASGVEARLIEAEAALQAKDYSSWLGKLNDLRATIGMAALTDPGTDAARVDTMFRERAFWLFGTGHRLGDLRRLMRQYGRSMDEVFPNGQYHKDNIPYGNEASIPIPQTEHNNPNYTSCDPTQP